jgi:hypothetical protein
MDEKLAALIEGIKKVLEDPAVTPSAYLTDGPSEELPESLRDVCYYLAPEALIHPNGRPNIAQHEKLAAAGFKVVCGERDSFGWLTGVIITPKGRIVYG